MWYYEQLDNLIKVGFFHLIYTSRKNSRSSAIQPPPPLPTFFTNFQYFREMSKKSLTGKQTGNNVKSPSRNKYSVCTCLKISTTGLRTVYFRMSLMINHEKMLLIRVQVLRQNFCPQILKDRPADSQRQHSAIYRQGG